jgi:hypothetical protein
MITSSTNKKSRKLSGQVSNKTNAHFMFERKLLSANQIAKIILNPGKYPAWLQRRAFAIHNLAR